MKEARPVFEPRVPDLRPAARLSLLVLLFTFASGQLAAQSAPPETAPADWGPISIDLEEIEYPYPVYFLERELFGQTARIAYMDVPPVGQPNGQSVLLMHGGSYYGWYWKDQIEALTREGYRVVVEDRLAWGKSSKLVIPYSWHLHNENSKAILDHLGIEQVAIVGHSMGGQYGTRFARLYPETATHLVMVNPIGLATSGEPRPAPTEPVVRATLPDPSQAEPTDIEAFYRSTLQLEVRRVVDWKPEYLEHVRIRYGNAISEDAAILNAARTANQTGDSMVGDWPLVRTPTLILAGEEDGPNFPDQVRHAAAQFPNGEYYLIPNVGHNPHLEVPEIVNRELLRFLGSSVE